MKALDELVGMTVELHILGKGGLGCAMHGILCKERLLPGGPICYEVVGAAAKAFFREEHFEAVTRQNVIWVRQ